MSAGRSVTCDISRESVCMGDDVDALHESIAMIDCTGVNDVALHCAEQVLAGKYLPSQAGDMTWIAEADG